MGLTKRLNRVRYKYEHNRSLENAMSEQERILIKKCLDMTPEQRKSRMEELEKKRTSLFSPCYVLYNLILVSALIAFCSISF